MSLSSLGVTRGNGQAARLARLLAVLAFLCSCGDSEKPRVVSPETRAATPQTRDVVIGELATLQEVVAAGMSTTGPARGVRLIRDGEDTMPHVGIGLRAGDRIITDGATTAVIGSPTGPKISLGANSDFTLREGSVSLELGSLLLSIKRIFQVETEFVVAGVKGTELALSVGSDAVMALVVDGTVEMQSKGEKWAPRSYTTGKGCVVRGTTAPKSLTRNAIAAFHQRDFDTAVALYDQALRADPGNAYVLNLKAYSLFKSKRLSQAVGTQRESLRADPEYAWGYFDLARFQCAAGDFNEARKSIAIAREKGGASLIQKMEGDGEFRRLCRSVLR